MPTKTGSLLPFLPSLQERLGHKLYLNDTGGFIMYLVLFMVGVKLFGLPLSLILAILRAYAC